MKNLFSLIMLLLSLLYVGTASAQPVFKESFNAHFYQLAQDPNRFTYQLRLDTGLGGFSSVFNSARWTGPGGVDFGESRTLSLTRDTFADLGADVFGDWSIEFTPSFPYQSVLGSAPRTFSFNIAPFDLAGMHTSRSMILSPLPGSTIPLPSTGGVFDLSWAYEDGQPRSGRSVSPSYTNLEMSGSFLGGNPEVYRLTTRFKPGHTMGTARFRAGSFRSNPTTVTGDANFFSFFAPASSYRNLSAEATYTIVAVPEPAVAWVACGVMVCGAFLRVRRGNHRPRGVMPRFDHGSTNER